MALNLNQILSPMPQQFWFNQLLTGLQGVGPCVQAAPNSNQIQGTGTVTPSGPATQAASVVVLISTSGNVGGGQFKYSTDGGVTFSLAITIPTGATSSSGSYLISTIGVTLTFTNGGYLPANVTNYFVAGETYSFTTFVPTFPVSNWSPGAPSLSFMQTDARAMGSLSTTMQQAIAGGFTQSWINPPATGAPASGWLDLLSQNVYNRPRIQGVATTGIVLLSNAGSASRTISAGEFTFSTPSGQTFTNTTGGTLPAQSGAVQGTLAVTVQATTPAASFNGVPTYNPAAVIPGGNYLNQIVTPTLPGLSVVNPINSNPTCVAASTQGGPATINFTGTATAAFNAVFLITSSGALGTSTYSVSLDGGNTYQSQGVTVGSGGFSYQGMTVAFPSGSYVSGATYSFSTGWITTYGADAQTDLSLATSDQDQWAQLAPSSPAGTFRNWAKAASAEVTNAFVTKSLTVPGQVNVLLVGQNNGPVSAAGVAAVQNYIQARLGVTDSVLVATVQVITVAVEAISNGIVQNASQATSVHSGIADALFKLQASLPPGGLRLSSGFGLSLSSVEAAILGVPGVIEIVPNTLELNSGSGFAAADVQLAYNQVVSITPPPASSFNPPI